MNEVFIEKAEVLRRFLQRSRDEQKQAVLGRPNGGFPKIRVPFLGVLIIRILLFRVLF